MREIERPWKTPGRCAIVAHVDPVTVPTARWLDTEGLLSGWDQHVYLSDVGVRQAMSVLGYPTPIEVEALEAQLDEAIELAETFKAERDEARRELQAIDALESADWSRRKRPGPKPKAVA